MNRRSKNAARFALNAAALAAACLCATPAAALGLGKLNVASALGETLRAEIEITSLTPEEAASLRLRVASPEAHRAAGVEYNAVLPSAQVQIVRRPDGRQVLRVTSDRAVLEPFVDVIIEATWASGRLVREYTMLFDPPSLRTAQSQPVPQQPPIAAAAPVPSTATPAPVAPPPAIAAAPLPPAPLPAPAQPAPAPSARPAPAPAAAPTPAPRAVAPAPQPQPQPRTAMAAAGGDDVRVRAGDTLSRIAARTQRPGISLDQMLVALYRGNPQAFMGDNMNRLKAGAVLSVPSAEQAARVSAPEAREIIVAQSNDFAAYRQRLAGGVTTAADAAPSRQARGQVQTQVEDRRAAAAPTPDRLTLSQGAVKASAPEARVSRSAERKDDATRLAELARNVDELKRLQGAAAPAPASAPAASPAPAPAAAQTPAAPPATTPPAASAPAVPPAPPVAASVPPTPARAAASTPAQAPAPKPAPTPPAAQEPGLLDSLGDNALLWPAAGVLIALLAGLGLYRLRSKSRKPAGETSFLESRLQPDSFFGASGGQRIDTRDASSGASSGNSSSMNYSLSQLDAIGDVDPVAEADVYLAYGRDLQAEEILKEAMRSAPERMAIRTKLLEVYAKRRDTKAFELLATQLHNLTHGEGEDWAKAQALGLSIDPGNLLYQPGGQPEEVRGAGGQVVREPLGASTVPYTAPVAPPAFQPAADATLDGGIDLELDMPGSIKAAAAPAPVPVGEMTQPFLTGAQMGDDSIDLRLDDDAEAKPAPAPRAAPPQQQPDVALDFDLDALGAEPAPSAPPAAAPRRGPAARPPAPTPSTLDFGEFAIDDEPLLAPQPAAPAPGADGTGDPLARKLELAEEFRQIGDVEGARDLLEEVVAKGNESLRAKAQGMLDKLG